VHALLQLNGKQSFRSLIAPIALDRISFLSAMFSSCQFVMCNLIHIALLVVGKIKVKKDELTVFMFR